MTSKPDFGPGDLVVCVDASEQWPVYRAGRHLSRGQTFRVERVLFHDFHRIWTVRLVGKPNPDALHGVFAASRFRKIDKADEQFTAQIRACKPVKQGEPA